MKQEKTFMLFCWFLFPAKQKKSWHVQVVRTSIGALCVQGIFGQKLLYSKNDLQKIAPLVLRTSVESPFYDSLGYSTISNILEGSAFSRR